MAIGNGGYSGSVLLWDANIGAFYWGPVTPPETGQVLTFNGTSVTWEAGGGLSLTYLALVSGVQSAGAAYKIIGALPTMDYAALGASSLTLTATLNIPAGSTAQVRLYDKTNAGTIWESAVIAGPQTEYELSQLVTPASGTSLLEFWLVTPTDDGGDASCLTAGIRASR